ncbi:MAG: DUF3768 domain-containing protein [Pseudomonadota bacterium]
MTTDTPTPEIVPAAVRIAAQNDLFRRQVGSIAPGLGRAEDGTLPGRVVFTHAVAAQGQLFPLLCLLAVAGYDTFEVENDPDGWHDFGAVEVEDQTVWFKIDLYADATMEWGSAAPDDPTRTYRVLTVMFPTDW